MNNGINKGRAATSKLNSILGDRNMTHQIKAQIYNYLFKSSISYATESWQVNTKTVAQLNSTEMNL